jgi:hypothetical protein
MLMAVAGHNYHAVKSTGKHVNYANRKRKSLHSIVPCYTRTAQKVMLLLDELRLTEPVRETTKTAFRELWAVYERVGHQIRDYTSCVLLALHHACLTHKWHVARSDVFARGWAEAMLTAKHKVFTGRIPKAATKLARPAAAANTDTKRARVEAAAADPRVLPEPLVKPEPTGLKSEGSGKSRTKAQKAQAEAARRKMERAVDKLVKAFDTTCAKFLPALPHWTHAPEHVLLCRAEQDLEALFHSDNPRLEARFKVLKLHLAFAQLARTCQLLARTRERFTQQRLASHKALKERPASISQQMWNGMSTLRRKAEIAPELRPYVFTLSLELLPDNGYHGFKFLDILVAVLVTDLCQNVHYVDETYPLISELRSLASCYENFACALEVDVTRLARGLKTLSLCRALDKRRT